METVSASSPVPKPVIRPKLGRNVAIFLAILFGIGLVLLSLIAFFVAKTGFVEVPVFSYFYHGPQLTRQVDTVSISAEKFNTVLAQRFIAAQMAAGASDLQVRITEQELTSVLNDQLRKALADPTAKIKKTQVVVRSKDIELYAHLRQSNARIEVLVRFVPRIEGDTLLFEPKQMWVGDIPVAPSLALKIASVFFSRDLGSWQINFGQLHIKDLRLQEGAIEIVAASQAR